MPVNIGNLTNTVLVRRNISPPTPLTFFTDTFTDADSTAITSHTPDSAPSGSAWSDNGTSAVINSNQFYVASASGSCNIETRQSEGKVSVSTVGSWSSGFSAQLLFRYADTTNFFLVGHFSGVTQLYRVLNNAFTLLGQANGAGTNDLIEVVLDGKNITVYRNGTSIITASDTNFLLDTKIGIRTPGGAVRMDTLRFYLADSRYQPNFFDNFDRTNGAIGNSTSGHAYATSGTAITIASNQASLSSPGGASYALTNYQASNGSIRAKIIAGTTAGIIFRYSDSNNYWLARNDATGSASATSLIKVVAGVATTISKAEYTSVAKDALEVALDGNRIAILRNGTMLTRWNDTFNASAASFGLWSDANATWDVFSQRSFTPLVDTGANAPLVVFDGNSLVAGFNVVSSDKATNVAMQNFSTANFINWGVSGQQTTAMITNAPTNIDPRYSASRVKNIVVMWEITNHLANVQNPTTVYNSVVSYCNARRAAGWQVVVMTCLPRTGQYANFETDRQTVNTNIRNNYLTFADALADVGNDATIGQTGQASNTTYFADGTHLTTSGYAIAAAYITAALQSLGLS